ncbi:MAG TPA: hypothetical protein VEI73_10275 [Candidatus Acidoferrum sp.]|nr:hypothetical protein [Candidatus Acidoferrum sp.]
MFRMADRRKPEQQPLRVASTVTIPGTKAGAIVSIGMVVICWFALPMARPFILGTGGVGLIVGLLLWWWHNRTDK